MNRPMRRFAFRLARDIGMSISEVYKTTTVIELAEWIAFYKLDNYESGMAASPISVEQRELDIANEGMRLARGWKGAVVKMREPNVPNS